MKKIFYFVAIALLLAGCKNGTNEPSYRDGKDISVAGKTFEYIRDTVIFGTDGTITRRSPLYGGVTTGTYTQKCEVVKYRLSSFEPTTPDGYAISYGDFIYFGGYYMTLIENF